MAAEAEEKMARSRPGPERLGAGAINSLAATNLMKKECPTSTKSPSKAPGVADAELDGVLALAARDQENSRARGQV
jgi:hypothetical protein